MPPSPIVLLHGQPGSPADWRAVAHELADFDVRIPTRPGYDGERDPGGFWENAAAAWRGLDDDGLDRAVIAGHSWGGGVALAMAMMMPARVAGLALVGSVGPGGVNVLDRFLAGRLGSTVADIGFRIASRVVNELAELAEPHVLRSFAVEQHALVHGLADVVDRLSTVRTPTVVITGTRDRVVSPQTARRLAESIPGAELLELARAGHSIPRRQPQVVASALRRLAA